MQEISKPQSEKAVVNLLSIAKPNSALTTDSLNRLVQFSGKYLASVKAPNQEDADGKVGTWLVGIFQVQGSGKIAVVRGLDGKLVEPPSSQVHVIGRIMPSQINNKFGEVQSGFLPRIDSALLLSEYGSDFFDGYVIARSENPESGLTKVPSPMPIVKVSGFYWQHISYVVIWWLMALLALAMPFLRNRSSEN